MKSKGENMPNLSSLMQVTSAVCVSAILKTILLVLFTNASLSSGSTSRMTFGRLVHGGRGKRNLETESILFNCSENFDETSVVTFKSYIKVSGALDGFVGGQSFINASDSLGSAEEGAASNISVPLGSNSTNDSANDDAVEDTFLIRSFIEAYNSFHNSSMSACLEEENRRREVTITMGQLLYTKREPGNLDASTTWFEVQANCFGCLQDGMAALFTALQEDEDESGGTGNSSVATKLSSLTACLCEPPTVATFTALFRDEIRRNILQLPTMDADDTMLELSSLEVMELKPIEPGCETLPIGNQEAYLLLYLNVESTSLNFSAIEHATMEVYNRINQFPNGLCDPFGRQIQSVSASTIDPNSIYPFVFMDRVNSFSGAIISLKLVLSCLGCGETTEATTAVKAFDAEVEAGRRNLLQHEEYSHCLCPTGDLSLEYRGPTLGEFEYELQQALPELADADPILDMGEFTTLPCDDATAKVQNLTQVILVDFYVNCSLVDADSSVLATEFVSVYNTLSEYKYCDPYLRQITTAEVLRRGDPSLEDGTLTLEMQLTGTCVGCDPTVDGFYHIPAAITFDATTVSINQALNTEVNAIEMNTTDTNITNVTLGLNGTDVNHSNRNRRRRTSDKAFSDARRFLNSQPRNLCYCPVDAVGARAPTEAEVMEAFRGFVQEASREEGMLRCVSSVGQCQFGTTFESSFLVAISESNATQEFASDLEDILQNTLNELFAPRQGICLPQFRLVQSVQSTIGVNVEGAQEILRRRNLGDSHGRTTQQDGTTVETEDFASTPPSTDFPTFVRSVSPATGYPSSVYMEMPTDNSAVLITPTASPTIEPPELSVLVLLSVSGVCNGCSSELLLQNQILDSSRRQMPEVDDDDVFPFVPVTTTEEPESNCFCPIEAIVQDGNPSADTVLDEYRSQLEKSDIPLDVTGIEEVQVIDCEDEIENFDTKLELVLLLRSDVSDKELHDLVDLVEDTYNDLIESRFCDPLIRRLERLDLDSMVLLSAGQAGCDLYSLTFDVAGTCRGCEDDSSLFDVDNDENESGRRLSTEHAVDLNGEQQRRRRLKGSDLCFCERQTDANRAPSLEEFEHVLGPRIDKEAFDMICGLSNRVEGSQVTDEPSHSPSLQPSDIPTQCTADLGNEFESEISLFIENAVNLDVTVRSLLGDAIEAAYNELMNTTYALCDHEYRQVVSISHIDEQPERRRLRGKEGDIWSKMSTESQNGFRMLQTNDATDSLRYRVIGRCEDCMGDSNFLDSLSGEQVLSRTQQLASVFMDSTELVAMGEINQVSCSNVVIEFNEVVIVELVATCLEEDNFGFSDSMTRGIAEAFVTTYNMLAADYCDPHFTILTSAKLENIGSVTIDGNIPIEIRAFAECLGCNPDLHGIYGNPSAIQGENGASRYLLKSPHEHSPYRYGWDRRLQGGTDCACSAQAVAKRPASEAEFINEFRKSVESLPFECVSSVGECQFGSTFDTDIVLSFEGNQTTFTDEVRQSIQVSFFALLNDLYEPNEEVCNPDFRVIVDVDVVFDFTLNGEFIESAVESDSERLLRNEEMHRRLNQETNMTDSDEGPIEQIPTASPTINTDSDLVRTLLTVSGVCNGCANELFLSNQMIFGGRGLGDSGYAAHYVENWAQRHLQGEQRTTNSNCFCPLTAIINLVPPSPEEVQGELSRRLEEDEVELVVRDIDTVSAIACDDESETTDFTSEFTFSFSAFPNIPDAEIERLGNVIASIYNDLVEDYCDPLIRREVILELVDRKRVIRSSTENSARRGLQHEDLSALDKDGLADCVNFEATFTVKGLCRGCVDGTPLLDIGGSLGRTRSLEIHNRILSSGERKVKTRRRHLANNPEECFCDSRTIAPRAPTLEELWLRLELELGSFVDTCGRPVECDPTAYVSSFSETTILALQLERGTFLTDAHLLELEVAYLAAYNNMQNSLRTDKCGGNFRRLSSITVDRSILGEGRRELEDDESSGRRLSVQSLSLRGTGECPRQCNFGRDLDVLQAMLDDIREVSYVSEVLAVNEFLTGAPSSLPSAQPSASPSSSPSTAPSASPSSGPSGSPSSGPSATPSVSPSKPPSASPSVAPSTTPSISPSMSPSNSPSVAPSMSPSSSPSTAPSQHPSISVRPSMLPSNSPTGSIQPSSKPSSNPSKAPSLSPSTQPSASAVPSLEPSERPSISLSPSTEPSIFPSDSIVPSSNPSQGPSFSASPSSKPSMSPSFSSMPSLEPSTSPSRSSIPSTTPSKSPSLSIFPSSAPTTSMPSLAPSFAPSLSASPSLAPTNLPSRGPTNFPTRSPMPTQTPTLAPFAFDTSFCDPPPDLCGTGTGYTFPDLAKLVGDLPNDCRGQSPCQGPPPFAQFYDQCAQSGATESDASCVCFPADGLIAVNSNICSSTDSCNCVQQTGARILGDVACTASGTCNFNTGTIGFTGQEQCIAPNSCNCNSATIEGAANWVSATLTANFNKGIISDATSFACAGIESCNFNAYLDPVFGVPTALITSDACSGNQSCNGNRGFITSSTAPSCTDEKSCNCNHGNILGACWGKSTCNNVPRCVNIRGGCANDNDCNWSVTEQANCCADKSCCSGIQGTQGTCEVV